MDFCNTNPFLGFMSASQKITCVDKPDSMEFSGSVFYVLPYIPSKFYVPANTVYYFRVIFSELDRNGSERLYQC